MQGIWWEANTRILKYSI